MRTSKPVRPHGLGWRYKDFWGEVNGTTALWDSTVSLEMDRVFSMFKESNIVFRHSRSQEKKWQEDSLS